MNFNNKKTLNQNIVFISGLPRSGKALLCPIVSSYNNTEKVNVDFSLELFPVLFYLNEINENAAKFLIQSKMNLAIYDNFIGRNSNFRSNDFTSVWKYRDSNEYIQRLTQPDGDKAIESLKKVKRIFPLMIHDGLWHADIWFKSLPTIKFIHIQRNPVDIAFSWIGKGFGGNSQFNERSNLVSYEYKTKLVPYYANGWEDKYLSLSQVDRVIHMIHHIRDCHQNTYDNLNDDFKKKIIFIKHQKLITQTYECLDIVSDFIGEEPSKETPSILLQENCPRDKNVITPASTNNNTFQEKLKTIEKLCSSDSFKILMDMHIHFESNNLSI
jgi:hypothetical protein